jgi:rhomboid protease GluP
MKSCPSIDFLQYFRSISSDKEFLLDWKRFFDNLGLNGTRWQWRIMRWERNLKDLRHGRLDTAGGSPVTNALIFLNLLFFTLMIFQGVAAGQGMRPLLNPDTYLLVHAGGQYWPLVYQGQWWRCITYAFTHAGLIHIGFNMVVLYQVGPLVEAEIGPAPYLVLYTATAFTATLLGLYWHPMVVVIGASGALFGLIGFAVSYNHRIGGPTAIAQRNFMFRWAVYAFIFGLLVGADNAGHLGGAAGGAILGMVMPLGLRRRRFVTRLLNLLGLACAALILVSLGMLVMSWFNA